MNKKLHYLSTILSFLALASLFPFMIGLKDTDNYLNWFTDSIILIVAGLAVGALLYIILCFILPEAKKYKNEKGVGLLLPLIFIFSFLSFGFGYLYNESKFRDKKCQYYVIQEILTSKGSRGGNYVFIDGSNGRERLSFGKAFNESKKEGDTVNLCIITGALGFQYYKPAPKQTK